MDFAQLPARYYLGGPMLRAGEPAEVLFTRALAYVYDQESDGVIPKEALPRLCPTRGVARARALVREGLWEVVPTGWRFAPGVVRIVFKDQLEMKRESGRTRQTRHRQRNRVTDPVSNGVTNGDVTRTEVEVEVDAAAAARGAAAAAVLPGPVDVLRAKLQAHTPLRGLRFDSLTSDQLARLAGLLEVHGDDPLVRVAIDTCRNPPPVHAGAFLGTWEALPAPGQRRLGVVRQQLCTTHSTVLSPSGACSACASDQKAAR